MLKYLLGDVLYGQLPTFSKHKLSEIRIREGRPVMFRTTDNIKGRLQTVADNNLIVKIVATATQNSLYAYEDEMACGYLFFSGGIRIGIAGRFTENCKKIVIKEIKSLLIRIPHQIIGAADGLANLFCDFENTLIVSPPSCGKTTLLRDMVRQLAFEYNVLVLDERYELSGGDAALDLGPNCDVLCGLSKSIAYRGAIRALAPDIIAVDEIFGDEELLSLSELAACGIRLVATLHGKSMDDVLFRLKNVEKVFKNIVFLNSMPHAGHIHSIVRRN